ncbi:outer membrane beta-barrel protein [candidate division KSB1 bacterium]|nr:outer membrane beta-barrel protein [candidate division KSB1 bacterium]
MKKLTCFLIAMLTVTLVLPAGAQLRVGIVGGMNIADLNVEVQNQPADVSSRTLFGIGGVVVLPLSQTMSLRFEPMYLQKGIGATELAIQPGVEYKSKSSYLELPLFLKAEFGNSIRPYIMAGPSIGILLSSDIEATVSSITFKGDAQDATKNIDVSAAFGAGVSYPVGKSTIFFEGRYFLGLTNTVKGGSIEMRAGAVSQAIDWDKNTDKIENRGLHFMAGVTFPLSK